MSKPNKQWPFEDPPNVATISLRDVMEGRAPILMVTHDADDGMWQFLDGRDAPSADDAVVLSLECVLDLEPTIAELPTFHSAGERGVKT